MAVTTIAAIGLAIAAASAVASTVGSMAQARHAQAQAQAQQDAAAANNARQQAELSRQQVETAKQGQADKSDRMRQADAELGSLRAAEGESGLTSTAFLGMANDIAMREGIDVSRLDHNTDEKIAALKASKEAAAAGYTDQITYANNQAASTTSKATFSAIGSGLQIAGNSYSDYRAEQRAKNLTDRTRSTEFPF